MGRIPNAFERLDVPVRAVVIETAGIVLLFVGLSAIVIELLSLLYGQVTVFPSSWYRGRTVFPAARYRCGNDDRCRCVPTPRRFAHERDEGCRAFSQGCTVLRWLPESALRGQEGCSRHNASGQFCFVQLETEAETYSNRVCWNSENAFPIFRKSSPPKLSGYERR